MDPNNIPFNTLKDPTSSGNQLQGPFCGKFDYMVLICPTFVHNKTYDGFVDHDSRIFVIEYQKEEVKLRLKLSCHFFFRGWTGSLFWTIALPQRMWKAALASWSLVAFQPAMQEQHLGSDTADHQHRKNIPRKRSHHRFFYTASDKTLKDISEDYAGKLCPEEYKEPMAELKKKKIYLSSLRPAPSIQNQNFQSIYTACLNRRSTTKSCRCWRPLKTAWNRPILLFAPCQQRSRTTRKAGCACFDT